MTAPSSGEYPYRALLREYLSRDLSPGQFLAAVAELNKDGSLIPDILDGPMRTARAKLIMAADGLAEASSLAHFMGALAFDSVITGVREDLSMEFGQRSYKLKNAIEKLEFQATTLKNAVANYDSLLTRLAA